MKKTIQTSITAICFSANQECINGNDTDMVKILVPAKFKSDDDLKTFVDDVVRQVVKFVSNISAESMKGGGRWWDGAIAFFGFWAGNENDVALTGFQRDGVHNLTVKREFSDAGGADSSFIGADEVVMDDASFKLANRILEALQLEKDTVILHQGTWGGRMTEGFGEDICDLTNAKVAVNMSDRKVKMLVA